MNKQTLWIATANVKKAEEFKLLFPEFEVKTILDLPNYIDTEENGLTFEENSLLKAKDLAKFVKGIAIGDDSGICVDALDGFPGIYSKRWAYPTTNWDEICQKLVSKIDESATPNNRQAQMVTTIGFYDAINDFEKTFYIAVEGSVSKIAKPTNDAFGYDGVFAPGVSSKTYSEMTKAEKFETSSRNLAVQQFKKFYKEYRGQEHE
ncbi:non-canonical purine NTP pyrophosphatase [Mesoplasma photuris]|uniref:non-canonical purine NTP pyrophosphatase n=1 Tax=Mesoplasma photuris TaxID=217731 RepID=UPI0004E1D85C|nr:non-canonical purine NTP pyrophosphatase [Mesoplasma photuris]